MGSSRYVRRGGLVVLGDPDPGGGEDPLVASTPAPRSPLSTGAIAGVRGAVGEVATAVVSGVPMDGVGSPLPALAAEGSGEYGGLVTFESFAPCVPGEVLLDAGPEPRPGAGPGISAESASEP
jgi:hypothetical protein